MTDIVTTKDKALDPRLNWAALSQVERDAAYDNNAAVKNSAALIAERNQLSEALRASRKSFLMCPMATAKGRRSTFIRAPTRQPPACSSCTAVTGSAIRATYLPCWQASRPMAGRLRFPGYSLGPDAFDGHRDGDIPVARLAGQKRRVLRHLRARRALGLVGPRPPRRNGARSPGRRRGLAISAGRSWADPRYGPQQCAEADQRGSGGISPLRLPPSTSGSTSPTARPNCRRWFSIQSRCMNASRRRRARRALPDRKRRPFQHPQRAAAS